MEDWNLDTKGYRSAPIVGAAFLGSGGGGPLPLAEKRAQQNPIKPLQSVLGDRVRRLFTGQVKSVTLQTAGGFDSAVITLQSSGKPDVILYALNENMIAWCADKAQPVCIGPGRLCYVTTTGESLTNATIQNYVGSPGQMHVAGGRAAPALQAPGVLPAYAQVHSHLGYPGPYRPLTQGSVA